MLEANRERKCSDLVQFKTKEEALREPGRLGLSWESTKKHLAVECPTCKSWHIIHISETLEGV